MSGKPSPEGGFYLPGLDALRFLAFLLVFFFHVSRFAGPLEAARGAGRFGLPLFFLLSGYLITELLTREERRTGRISLRAFYIRRILRIWPLYYAAVAAGGLATLVLPSRSTLDSAGWISLAFFGANFFPASLGVMGPLWSISIEEQFYLLWPLILRSGGRIAAEAASLLFGAAAAVWIVASSPRGFDVWFGTPAQFLYLAGGAQLSLRGAVPHAPFGPGIRTAAARILMASAGFGAFLAAQWLALPRVWRGTPGGQLSSYITALAGCVLLFLAAAGLRNVPGWIRYAGKISYGLYVYHWPALNLLERAVPHSPPGHGSRAPIWLADCTALALTFAAAHITYQYFETPFLRMKEKFEVVRSRPL